VRGREEQEEEHAMGRFALGALVLAGLSLTSTAQAQSWQLLDADGVRAVLTDKTYEYQRGEVQEFFASGRTLYSSSRPSWGYWEVRGAQYCSQWPPSDLWACYSVAQRGAAIRFIGAHQDVYDAVPKE